MRREDAAAIDVAADLLPIIEAAIGKTRITGDTAEVETRVTLAGTRPSGVPLTTHLVFEDGQWKVDYVATTAAVSMHGALAGVLRQIREFSTALQRGIEQSTDELERALPGIEREISRIERQLHDKLPALRETLQEFGRSLDDLFENGPRPNPRHPPATHAI